MPRITVQGSRGSAALARQPTAPSLPDVATSPRRLAATRSLDGESIGARVRTSRARPSAGGAYGRRATVTTRGASASSSSTAARVRPHAVSSPASAPLAVEFDLPPRVGEAVDHARGPTPRRRPSRSRSMSRSSSSSGRAQPVRVDVHERRAADERRMRPRDDERGALHGSAHAEPRRDAPRERRLARAERTGEHDEVAGAQHPPDAARRTPPCRRAMAISWRPTSGSSPLTPTPAGAARAARCASRSRS